MLLQITFGNLATGLTRAASRYRTRQIEEEERRRQAEMEALRQQVLEFNLAEGQEARQARRRQEKTAEQAQRAEAAHRKRAAELLQAEEGVSPIEVHGVQTGQLPLARAYADLQQRRQAEQEREARSAIADDLEGMGLGPEARAVREGLAEPSGVLSAYRSRQRRGGAAGPEAVTPTSRYSTRARLLISLLDEAEARARRAQEGGIRSSDFLEEEYRPKTIAEIRAEIEEREDLAPGSLTKAARELLVTGEFGEGVFDKEPPAAEPAPAPEAGSQPIPEEDVLALQQAFRGQDPDTVREILAAEGIIESDIQKVLAGI